MQSCGQSAIIQWKVYPVVVRVRDSFFLQSRDCCRWEKLPSIATLQYGGKSQIRSSYNVLDLFSTSRKSCKKEFHSLLSPHVWHTLKKCKHTLLKRSIIQDSHKTVGAQWSYPDGNGKLAPFLCCTYFDLFISGIRYRCVNKVIASYETFIIAHFILSQSYY